MSASQFLQRIFAGILAVCSVYAVCVVTAPLSSAQTQCQAGIDNYVTETPWTNELFDLESLHDIATGKGVTVAVIDSGVNTDNPHLKNATVDGTSFLHNDMSNGKADAYGHGTVIAGIIASRSVEGSSVIGLAPDANIMSIRVFEKIYTENGNTVGAPSIDTLAKAIRLATQRGAQVINLSMSTPIELDDPKEEAEAKQAFHEAIKFAESHGTLIVASAGNVLDDWTEEEGPRYPAAFPEVIGVTGVNMQLTAHVTEDGQTVQGEHVTVAAPGMQIASTVPSGVDCVFSDQPSASYATAFVSAQAALIVERYPDEKPAQWRQRITATAHRAHPDHRTDTYGWGVIDPMSSLTVELSDDLRGGVDENTATQSSQHEQAESVILEPLRDDQARSKHIAALLIVATVVICGITWLIQLQRRDHA